MALAKASLPPIPERRKEDLRIEQIEEWIDEIGKSLLDMARIVKDLDDRLRKLESCASHRSWYA
jgi:hypothetical protein